MSVIERVKNGMEGRLAQRHAEAQLITSLAKYAELWVEIGCLWGGSAILASMGGADQVISIDSGLTEYWTRGDSGFGNFKVSVSVVKENFHRFGLKNIKLVMQPSYPWPLSHDLHPDVVLIDGDHSHPAVSWDWHSVCNITRKYVLFHDYQAPNCPAVTETVNNVASEHPDWEHFLTVEHTALMRRVDDQFSLCNKR